MTKNTGPSVIVIQILIGTGSIRGAEDYNEVLKNFACPTVKRWAERCGYEYLLLTRSDREFPPQFLKHIGVTGHDYVVAVDADIVIKDNAPSLNLRPGFGACRDCDDNKHWNRLLQTKDATNPYYTFYFNSGFTVADRVTANWISDYMIDYYHMESVYGWNDEIWDQHLVNYAVARHPSDIELYDLGEEWNFFYWWLYTREANELPKNIWAVHYTGDGKKQINEKSHLPVF